MRIGIIRRRYNPFGGAEAFLQRFIEALEERGHTVEIFSAGWPAGGATVHRVDDRGPSFLRPLVFARNVKKAITVAAPDVVVSLERTLSQDIYRAGDGCHREWLIRRKKTLSPVRRLAIDVNPFHRVMLGLEKRLFTDGRLRMVVANSRRVRDEITRHYGLPEKRICVIYNGINPSEFKGIERSAEREARRRDLGMERADVALLFVGSGFERKGLTYLIRALGILKEEKIKLVVAGKGSTSRYRKEAARLGVKERVFFLGPVRDTRRLYPAGDIFVLPSIYEPFSNACLEAMASGLPVVTSRANGFSEIITEGLDGAVVEDPVDAASLARAIALFLDGERRAGAGRLATEKASNFTMERTVDAFLKVMEEVAGGPCPV